MQETLEMGAAAAAPTSAYKSAEDYSLIWKPETLLGSAVGCVIMKIPIHISHGCHKQKSQYLGQTYLRFM